MKILIVEDDPIQRKYLLALLTNAGHEVSDAKSGDSAWPMIEAGDFKIVISDWMMPGLSGTELVKKIRERVSTDYMYIMILSAKDTRKNMIEGLESGADDYIAKPLDKAELMARLKIAGRILDLEQRLKDMALRDALTGVFNRHAFVPDVEAEFIRADRARIGMGVLMIDIDNFKGINDTYGHGAGDETLRQVAQAIRISCRPYDTVCRWGGEEFVVLIADCDSGGLFLLADRIRKSIGEAGPFASPQGDFRVTASVGSAYRRPDSGTLAQAITLADECMYKAKKAGKNRVNQEELGA